jgi:DNA-binding NtrC family response regulator
MEFNNSCPFILIDDEKEILETEELVFHINGIGPVHSFTSPQNAYRLLDEIEYGVVFLDLSMPDISGHTVQEYISNHKPGLAVVVLTGFGDAETAVSCMKRGAYDYVVKPIDQKRLITVAQNAREHVAFRAQFSSLKGCVLCDEVSHPEMFEEIYTRDRTMLKIFQYIEAIAPTNLPVLLTGETGVGKELFARAVHKVSGRSGEFVSINSAGIDDTLFSDTLFGHVAGAFTGANKQRHGAIERAVNGTLFLDEIGDMNSSSQLKLLRLLQEGTYYKLGSEIEEKARVRIVAATNRSLDDLFKDNLFRKDLFYRLKSHHINIPPLRERVDDIALLSEHFIKKAALEMGKKVTGIPQELYTILSQYSYPGNIRELRGMIYDAVSRHHGGGYPVKR